MKKTLFYFTIICLAFILQGHIGSPGITLEGEAGPYSLTVVVNSPDVIPGTAKVDIYVADNAVKEVMVKPVYWFAGSEGTPRADQALPVPGETGHFKGEIWLMTPGSASLEIEVNGEKGEGKILIPVMAVSTAQKSMDPALGWSLAGLGIFLVILMITIIGLSSGDTLVKPGDKISGKIKRKRWVGATLGFVLMALVLWGGSLWWNTWKNDYQRFMYKPFTATSTVYEKDQKQRLKFMVDSTKLESLYLTRSLNYLIPDHGKIMHMFLVRAGQLDVFAHLHPQRLDSAHFETIIPPLPAGEYHVFTDVSRLSGFSETIADTVIIPEADPIVAQNWKDSLLLDTDDTYYITDPIISSEKQVIMPGGDIVVCGSPGKRTMLPDSSYVTLEIPDEGKFTTESLYHLTLAVQDKDGSPATLDPYLGMMGHAVVFKEDGSVYIHLHPVGSYSMASQETMEARLTSGSGRVDWDALLKPNDFRDSVDRAIAELNALPAAERDSLLLVGMEHPSLDDPDHPDHSVVRFPYTFPTAGKYRIYVQMKRNGRILNGAFDVEVES
ncbi:hypothetical protein AAGF08_16430 [Algoriphagus sp. SE2]|uniref:hypothetical protein n=1 Tax=Algoriphagus sp. SE2 TaxID=3141536 RepID=UPI0031CD0FEC